MAPKPKYTEGEKILCYHGPVLYEAKVLQIQITKETLYLVHYQGWNKNWDEWVDEERMVKHNEQGLQKQKELKSKNSGKKSGGGGIKKKVAKTAKAVTPAAPEAKTSTSATKVTEKESVSRSSTPSNEKAVKHKIESTSAEGSRRKKQKVEPPPAPEPVPEEPILPKVEVNIKLPEVLKPVLVDDWDFVNRQKMLVQLPAERNIDVILNEYYESKVSKDKESRDTVLEITKGIRDYFNTMLGTQLLYKFERPQYGELVRDHKDKLMTDMYGAVHLLRLFVKIGSMLSYTALDDKSMSVLITHVQDFLRWMSKNVSALFNPTDYYSAPADYHRKALL